MSLFMPFQKYCHLMRQYVLVAPWWPYLSCASMSTVYFQTFGMTRVKNFWFESVACLYSNPLMWRKRSASCFWAYRMDQFSASVVGHVVCLLLVASAEHLCVFDCSNIWCDSVYIRLRSEMLCYVVLCTSAPGIKCWSILISSSGDLDCGLPIMW